MFALSLLCMIGMVLMALVFSILDEFLTFRLRRGKKAQAIVLHKKYMKDNYHQ